MNDLIEAAVAVVVSAFVIHILVTLYFATTSTTSTTEEPAAIVDLLPKDGLRCVISRRIQYFGKYYYRPREGILNVTTSSLGWTFAHPAFRGGYVHVSALQYDSSLHSLGYALQKS